MQNLLKHSLHSDETELQEEIDCCYKNPVITELMDAQCDFSAILNKNHKILLLNKTFLKMFKIHDASDALGMRMGDAFRCIHVNDSDGGCGAGELCKTCGVNIAMATGSHQQRTTGMQCAMAIDNRDDKVRKFLFQVHCCPITINNHRFLLLSLQDISYRQELIKLEQEFFHDTSNMMSAILGASQLLSMGQLNNSEKFINLIHRESLRLTKRMGTQRALLLTRLSAYQPEYSEITSAQVVQKINSIYHSHPAAKNKLLTIAENDQDLSFHSDYTLLMRILNNMLINAFEASTPGGEVKFSAYESHDTLIFSFWNNKEIKKESINNIFNLGFSTKAENGRGLGTFYIKFLGENILGGKVSFTTSETEGTLFSLALDI